MDDEQTSEPWAPKLPPPARAEGVPEAAHWDEERTRWIAGAQTDDGAPIGTWRVYAINGALLSEREHQDGKAIAATAFHPDGSIAAKATHRPDDDVTTHECFFPDGKLWSRLEYRGAIDGLVSNDRILREELRGPDGKVLREIEAQRDADGIVSYRERGPSGPVFANLRTATGREIRVYRRGVLEATIRVDASGGKPRAIPYPGGAEVTLEVEGLGEATRSEIEGDLGGLLYAATIEALDRPAPVEAFVAKNKWAAKVAAEAPFAHASVAGFLTGLGSPSAFVRAVSILGLGNLVEEKRHAAVVRVLDALASLPAWTTSAADAKKHLALVHGGDDDDEHEHDHDHDPDEEGHTHDEVEIGRVTLPSGDLVLVDMGAMGQWSHDAPHHADLSGSAWAGVANAKRDDYVDHVVTGPDASRALAAFAAKHGEYLFDVTNLQSKEGQKLFAKLAKKEGFDAALEVSPERIGHGARVALFKAAGLPYGSFGFAHVNVVTVFGLPRDRELPVVARRTDEHTWAYVSLVCKPSEPVTKEKIAALSIEEARFMFADAEALRAWDHERSIDGLYDLVFWNADDLAETFGAEEAYPGGKADYLGWTDLAPLGCPPQIFAAIVEGIQNDELSGELRSHSTHYAILRGAWESPHEAGTAVIGGAKMCGLFSSVGDGVFDVLLERDADGDPCRITVVIAGDEDDEEEEEEEEDEDEDEDEDEEDEEDEEEEDDDA